jgi:hypothetical protein
VQAGCAGVVLGAEVALVSASLMSFAAEAESKLEDPPLGNATVCSAGTDTTECGGVPSATMPVLDEYGALTVISLLPATLALWAMLVL